MVLSYATQSRVSGVYDTRNFFANAAGCHLFLNERDSDVAIKVEWDGSSWHLPAHRLVLTSMSEVFRKMLEVDMSEKNCGQITIKDSSPLTVKYFLKYLYMGTLDFNGWTEAVELMKIAHKYSVQTLVTLCESYLTTALTFANACYLYEIAQTYCLNTLERHVANFILDAAFIITSTDGFFNLKPKSLEFFLKSLQFNMENECTVLTTLREWALVQCSRRGLSLTRENVLNDMKPFMKYIHWDIIPEQLRTFVPEAMVIDYESQRRRHRKTFYVAPSLQNHTNVIKFIVELGTFYEDKTSDTTGLSCLKFGVDNHAYVAGFKMIGMFETESLPNMDRSSLMLGRDDHKSYSLFNLNSLPWTKGASVGDYVWRELTAYLPYPVRVDPFSTYILTLKYDSRRSSLRSKWPYTRLDSGIINSSLGNINFHCCSECYGITQLFMLPAAPSRNVCNDDS